LNVVIAAGDYMKASCIDFGHASSGSLSNIEEVRQDEFGGEEA